MTPRFLRSTNGRREVDAFLAAATSAGEQRWLLPILYQDVLDSAESDPLLMTLLDRQYKDWTELKYEDRTAGAHRRAIDRLASRLQEATATDAQPVERHSRVAISDDGGAESEVEPNAQDDPDDLLSLFESLEAIAEALPADATRFQVAFQATTNAFRQGSETLAAAGRPSATQMRTMVGALADHVRSPAAELEAANQVLATTAHRMDEVVVRLIELGDGQDDATLDLVRRSILDHLPTGLGIDDDELDRATALIGTIGRLAHKVRPTTRTFERSVALAIEVDAMLHRWRELATPRPT